ncbi:MAG: hypothetical protein Q8Q09_09460 [Deltaproteobacteria bacterium]|nr:hypothetical protein [Deltaproteobacteria bacterium]
MRALKTPFNVIYLSLVLNVVVLVPVCLGLLANAEWTLDAYGPSTPARGILLSIYLAIGLGSAALLLRPEPRMVVVLLIMQVLYKLTTPWTVGTVRNPVVRSNLAIAAIHIVTLARLLRDGLVAIG